MNNEMIKLAMSYLDRGWSVLPCGKNKIPLVSWREFQSKYPTKEEIEGWFEKYPDAQVGIITGKNSNLTVVDVEEGGDPSFLPQDTMIVGTGGGGYHYFFTFEDGVTNKARIKELVDIRGEGGYVVAPGSVSEKGPYKLLQDAELKTFPKELFPAAPDIFDVPESAHSTYGTKDFKEYPGYGKGQRNSEMASYIGYVLTQVHPSDWVTIGWNIIAKANESNMPPLPPQELQATFNSIKDAEKRNNPLGHLTGQKTSETGSPQGVSEKESPIIMDNDEIKHIADVADEQALNQTETYPLQMECFDEVILGGVSAGDIIVIAGQTGQGKTTLAQDWTMSLIRGDKKVKALWFSYEVLTSHLWNKFQEMGMTREDCAFIPAKHSDGNVTWVEKKIKEGKERFGIKSVFIDHLGFLLPKTSGILGKNLSSNYAAFITQIMRDLKTIALREEVMIFLPVHMKQAPSHKRQLDINDIKDSSGVGQEADLVFLIEREKDRSEDAKTYFTEKTTITLAKNRKTGMTVVSNFYMMEGRFAHDDSVAKADEMFDSIDDEEVKEEKVDKRIVETETLKDIIDEEMDKEA